MNGIRTTGAAALITVLTFPAAGSAQGVEATANVGWSSEYFFRGIPQKTSSASAGLDVELGGAYLGSWAADVGDGAEVDVYGGYGVELQGLSLTAGGTGYFYTGGFDDTYLEANLGSGYGPLNVELSIGRHGTDPEPEEYWFLATTLEHAGAYGTFGTFGDALDGTYGEVGYRADVEELFELSVGWIYSTGEILGTDEDDHTLVLGVAKTFTLR